MRPATPLPEGALEHLQAALKQAKSKSEFQRIQCLWLRGALGLNADQVALAVGWSPSSVRRLQARYLREGAAALQGVARGGRRHENLSQAAEVQLLQRFVGQAERGGLLEVGALKHAYERAVGHAVPKSTIYRMLARHGWRKIAPRRRHPKADPQRQQAFKKTLPNDPPPGSKADL